MKIINSKSDKNNDLIYLDFQSTTPVDSRVLEKMLPFYNKYFANPHSSEHLMGRYVEKAVEESRKKIANLIGANSNEIIFTSGATESNNIAIKGVSRFYKKLGKNEIITLPTEHKCVLESVLSLKEEGFKINILPVKSDGLIDLDMFKRYINKNTALVSIMTVNNEIGVIQPINKIGKICKEMNVIFHTDAAQAAGKINLDVNDLNVDLMSLSSHKMYGPKGIGSLYIRRRPRVRLNPIFSGGQQERGIRSGTLPAQLCVGFGMAAEIASKEIIKDAEKILVLSKKFLNTLNDLGVSYKINGSTSSRWVGNLNLMFKGINSEKLLNKLENLCLSTGSACSDSSINPSYVLESIGLSDDESKSSIRIGFGKTTNLKETIDAAKRIYLAIENLNQNLEN